MKSDLRAYFERIEAAFCRERGAPLLLSPLDFEKAVEWFAAGLPLEVVEAGIAEYFARLSARKVPPRRAVCLSFAEDRVIKALEAHRAAAIGRAAGASEPGPRGPRVARFIGDGAARLEAFCADPARARALPVLAKACARSAQDLRDLVARAGEPAARIEALLAPLDRDLCRLVLLESPKDLLDHWKVQAFARLGDLAEGMDHQALRQTVDKLACQSALAHWDLPRLSLLYLEE